MPLPSLNLPVDIAGYLAEITSEHQEKIKYIQTVSVTVQPFADTTWTESNYYLYYDLDLAVGVQLDGDGEWIGRTRFLPVPFGGYFSWSMTDIHLGWGQAPWKRPFDSEQGTVVLPDEPYRLLLRAVIIANHWDGTVPGAYDAYDVLFPSHNQQVLIQDYGNGSMALILVGPSPPDVITQGLFTLGELDLKPVGIRLWHVLPTVYPAAGDGAASIWDSGSSVWDTQTSTSWDSGDTPWDSGNTVWDGSTQSIWDATGQPLFGFGADNKTVAGWGHGAWGKFYDPE